MDTRGHTDRQEFENACVGLIDKLTAGDFKAEDFKDEYRIRVRTMLEGKAKGKEIVAAPAEPARKHGEVIDLMQALKQSLVRRRKRSRRKKHDPLALRKSERRPRHSACLQLTGTRYIFFLSF